MIQSQINLNNLEALNESIFNCSKCISENRTVGYPYPMFIGSESDCSILVIGQSPGIAFNDKDPIVFSYENKLPYRLHSLMYHRSLAKSLIITFVKNNLGLMSEKLLWTNVCKCVYLNNQPPNEQEIRHGKIHLFKQIELIKPQLKLVITLGKPASSVFNVSPSSIPTLIKFDTYSILPLYHPAYIRRINDKQHCIKATNIIKYMELIKCL